MIAAQKRKLSQVTKFAAENDLAKVKMDGEGYEFALRNAESQMQPTTRSVGVQVSIDEPNAGVVVNPHLCLTENYTAAAVDVSLDESDSEQYILTALLENSCGPDIEDVQAGRYSSDRAANSNKRKKQKMDKLADIARRSVHCQANPTTRTVGVQVPDTAAAVDPLPCSLLHEINNENDEEYIMNMWLEIPLAASESQGVVFNPQPEHDAAAAVPSSSLYEINNENDEEYVMSTWLENPVAASSAPGRGYQYEEVNLSNDSSLGNELVYSSIKTTVERTIIAKVQNTLIHTEQFEQCLEETINMSYATMNTTADDPEYSAPTAIPSLAVSEAAAVRFNDDIAGAAAKTPKKQYVNITEVIEIPSKQNEDVNDETDRPELNLLTTHSLECYGPGDSILEIEHETGLDSAFEYSAPTAIPSLAVSEAAAVRFNDDIAGAAAKIPTKQYVNITEVIEIPSKQNEDVNDETDRPELNLLTTHSLECYGPGDSILEIEHETGLDSAFEYSAPTAIPSLAVSEAAAVRFNDDIAGAAAKIPTKQYVNITEVIEIPSKQNEDVNDETDRPELNLLTTHSLECYGPGDSILEIEHETGLDSAFEYSAPTAIPSLAVSEAAAVRFNDDIAGAAAKIPTKQYVNITEVIEIPSKQNEDVNDETDRPELNLLTTHSLECYGPGDPLFEVVHDTGLDSAFEYSAPTAIPSIAVSEAAAIRFNDDIAGGAAKTPKKQYVNITEVIEIPSKHNEDVNDETDRPELNLLTTHSLECYGPGDPRFEVVHDTGLDSAFEYSAPTAIPSLAVNEAAAVRFNDDIAGAAAKIPTKQYVNITEVIEIPSKQNEDVNDETDRPELNLLTTHSLDCYGPGDSILEIEHETGLDSAFEYSAPTAIPSLAVSEAAAVRFNDDIAGAAAKIPTKQYVNITEVIEIPSKQNEDVNDETDRPELNLLTTHSLECYGPGDPLFEVVHDTGLDSAFEYSAPTAIPSIPVSEAAAIRFNDDIAGGAGKTPKNQYVNITEVIEIPSKQNEDVNDETDRPELNLLTTHSLECYGPGDPRFEVVHDTGLDSAFEYSAPTAIPSIPVSEAAAIRFNDDIAGGAGKTPKNQYVNITEVIEIPSKQNEDVNDETDRPELNLLTTHSLECYGPGDPRFEVVHDTGLDSAFEYSAPTAIPSIAVSEAAAIRFNDDIAGGAAKTPKNQYVDITEVIEIPSKRNEDVNDETDRPELNLLTTHSLECYGPGDPRFEVVHDTGLDSAFEYSAPTAIPSIAVSEAAAIRFNDDIAGGAAKTRKKQYVDITEVIEIPSKRNEDVNDETDRPELNLLTTNSLESCGPGDPRFEVVHDTGLDSAFEYSAPTAIPSIPVSEAAAIRFNDDIAGGAGKTPKNQYVNLTEVIEIPSKRNEDGNGATGMPELTLSNALECCGPSAPILKVVDDTGLDSAFGVGAVIGYLQSKEGGKDACSRGLNLTDTELGKELCDFLTSEQQSKGERFRIDSFYYLILGVQKTLKSRGSSSLIFYDTPFRQFIENFDLLACQHIRKVTDDAIIAKTVIAERMLWQSCELGTSAPILLLNTMMYLNTKLFHIREFEEHRHLKMSTVLAKLELFMLQAGINAEENFEYTEINRLYKLYFSLRPKSEKRRGRFYLQPLTNAPGSVYTKDKLSTTLMKTMLNRIHLVQEIFISKHICYI